MKKIYVAFILLLGIIVSGCSSAGTRNFEASRNSSGKDRMSYFSKYGYPAPEESRGKEIPYLQATSHIKGRKTFLNRYSEKKILEFYKDLNIEGFGDNSYFWRWHFAINERDLSRSVNKTIYSAYNSRPSSILTLSGGKWVRKHIPANPVGTLRKVIVLERGKSGVITYLLVSGTNGEYLVKGEYAVRQVLGLSKSNTGVTVKVLRAKSGDNEYSYRNALTNPSLLPSGFLAIEKKGSRYYVYGGGYGHGVGMSQYGAYDLAKNYGYKHKKILNCYYTDMDIKNMYKLDGVGKTIRVGITTKGHKSLDHSIVSFTSHSKATLTNSWMNMKLDASDKVKIESNGKRMIIYVNGKKRAETIQGVKYDSKNDKVIVTSLRRGHRKTMYPVYRGTLEIKLSKTNPNALRVINEVKMEDYLLQVLPSEMPESFGLEALKAQAVAARTYALNDYFNSRFKKEGFHVIDDTRSQMYNNVDENPDSTKAIKQTYGEVMLYNGKPIDAKYYSTSSGYGASAHNIW